MTDTRHDSRGNIIRPHDIVRVNLAGTFYKGTVIALGEHTARVGVHVPTSLVPDGLVETTYRYEDIRPL